jgi:putative ABC transport system permease protein
LIVRADDPLAAIPLIKSAVWGVDPEQPVDRIQLATDALRDTFARQRFVQWLMTSFAAIGALLAAAGVFGVLSYVVTQRTRDIGIRMAVGASPWHIVRLVVWRGAMLVLAGVGIGTVGAMALARGLETLLYDVPALDPVSFALGGISLALVGLLASSMPVHRARRIDPAIALRVE